MKIHKKGKIHTIILALDIIGFFLLFVGAAMIRLGKDEIIPILGGFVLAGGIAVISLTKIFSK
jgi:hypothetical protein